MSGLVQCPKCPSRDLPAYAARHAARHARREREYAAAVAADIAVTARYGPVRKPGPLDGLTAAFDAEAARIRATMGQQS